MTRREVLGVLPASVAAARAAATGSIDRKKVVSRHNPVLRRMDVRSPLSVGNGEFAFTADITGLQTFSEAYEPGMPLCTQSQWGWHSFPNPKGFTFDQLRLTNYDTHGRPVGYPTKPNDQKDLFDWLRENPHRLHLGRIAFAELTADKISDIEQTLDLWTGVLASRFRYEGVEIAVETCCHPMLDVVAVRVRSGLLADGKLRVQFAFPYGSPQVPAADWKHPESHRSIGTKHGSQRFDIARELDADRYFVSIGWYGQGRLEAREPHHFELRAGTGEQELEFVCWFSQEPRAGELPRAARVLDESLRHWAEFWSHGGAVDLSGTADKRAQELERRIVLSQYLTAIQCAGSLPPQETGLTCNSWNGKFHLEMHWWHAAHFPMWGRAEMLERSLGWYDRILPEAQKIANRQGYAGARWPKMVGPDGVDSPSPIGPLLIWQQPHPISYAEFCYRAHPNRETLARYKNVVFQTAEFMASYAWWDAARGRYVLGPPVIPAQENHPPNETWNPTFELEYWHYALGVAQNWRERLGLGRDPRWERVRTGLSELPVKDGVYLGHENCPQTFTERNRDHPSMLGALGILPGAKVDRETMRRTLHKALTSWRWADTWGWDYPMTAMTAARLDEPEVAIDALLMDTPKNVWLPNGHNYQRPGLTLYLPSNGGLLTAIAMMAAGWKGAPARRSPGFPGEWVVTFEGLSPLV